MLLLLAAALGAWDDDEDGFVGGRGDEKGLPLSFPYASYKFDREKATPAVGAQEQLSVRTSRPHRPPLARRLNLTGTGLMEPIFWDLKWNDEFDDCPEGLPDPQTWQFEVGFTRKDELQYNMNRGARCVDGKLRILAENHPGGRKIPIEDVGPCHPGLTEEGCAAWRKEATRERIYWSSASVMSRPGGTGELKQGQYDARVRFSTDIATDARWWTTGEPAGKKYAFPQDGSMVVMQYANGAMQHYAVHDNRILERTEGFQRFIYPIWEGGSVSNDWSNGRFPKEGFHDFSLRWSENSLDYFINGVHTLRIQQDSMYAPDLSWTTNPYAWDGLRAAIMRFTLSVPRRVVMDNLRVSWPLTMEM